MDRKLRLGYSALIRVVEEQKAVGEGLKLKRMEKMKPWKVEKRPSRASFYGGTDETRTRDLRRDRPAF